MKSILKNKRGEVGENMMIIIVIFFVTMIVIGMVIWMFSTMTEELVSMPSIVGETNMSDAAQDTFGQVNAALINGANVIAFSILIGMVLAMLLIAYLSKENPAFFFLDWFVLIMTFIISVYLSNRYEELLNGLPFTDTLISMKAGTSVMLHLPRWVTVIGLFGIALSFIGIQLRKNTGDFQ